MADISKEAVERMAQYYIKWAADIRKMNGHSVDADHAELTAATLQTLSAKLAAALEAVERANIRADDQAMLVNCACAYDNPTDLCDVHKRIVDAAVERANRSLCIMELQARRALIYAREARPADYEIVILKIVEILGDAIRTKPCDTKPAENATQSGLCNMDAAQAMTVQEDATQNNGSGWQWWAGANEEWFTIGPCDTKEQAIDEALNDGIGEWLDETQDPPAWMQSFFVVEARQYPLKLSDWINADLILDLANENLVGSDRVSSENDDGPWFEVTPEQQADLVNRLKSVCDEWQSSHGLVFHSSTFSHQRNSETIIRAIAGGRDE